MLRRNIKKAARKRATRKKEVAKRKKKKEKASWRTKVKSGAYSKASQKRRRQPLKAESLDYVPKSKKTSKKKLSFKEKVQQLSGKKAKSTLRANASEWDTHNASKWVPESLRGIGNRIQTLSRKIVPTGRKKTRRRGVVSLEKDPSRMNKLSGLHSYLRRIPMFRTAANLTIRELNRLRLTDYKTFMTLDPRSLNPHVQRYFRNFYENASPGYAIPFTSRIGDERARLMLENPGMTKKEAKEIKKSLHEDQNPDMYGVDDWEHVSFMNASRKKQKEDHPENFANHRGRLYDIDKNIVKLKRLIKIDRDRQRYSMRARMLNKKNNR